MRIFAFLPLVVVLVIPAACEDDHDHGTGTVHSSPYPTCDAIIKQCHPFDFEEGPIHDCHDLAHGAKSDADCVPQKDHCLAICVATDGGAGHEGHDGG